MNSKTELSIGVVVPTLNAKRHLHHCLFPFLRSPLQPRVLVVDSSSRDGTAEQARALGAEVLVIPAEEFNHGATRELARRHLGTDIVVMVTQDCYPENAAVLAKLVRPLMEEEASIAYARQRPHFGAGIFEAFPRKFNYPSQSHIRGVENLDEFGVYTFFCSNSCAAYMNSALEEIDGFEAILLGEDTVATAKLLRRGHKIAYVADAIVRHSHCYSLKEEFRRSFHTGFVRRSNHSLLSAAGGDARRGRAYAVALFKQLWKKKPLLLPYGILQTMLKWAGYQMGRRSARTPSIMD